jgi:subtilisin family serine protease
MEGNDIHGTPCAGVAAAVANRRGGVGLAYKSKILPVKVFGADSLASNDRVADAIRYAGQHAQVISCSWSGPMNPDLESAIDDVTRDGRNGRGCLVFCATGNDYKAAIGFPARHPDVFAIGASNDQGKRAKYSNYGPGIRFVAPSSDPDMGRQGITTTDVSLRNRGFNIGGHYTHDFGGTSSATPLAAAIGALVLSVSPGLSRIQVRNLLQASAVKIDSATGAYRKGYSLQYGFGCLDAFAAVSAAQKARARRTARKKKAKGTARGARKGRAAS